MKSRRRKKRPRILPFGALLATVLIVWTIIGNGSVQRTNTDFASARVPEGLDGFVIAHISDLHDAVLGEDNEQIVTLVSAAQPDIIVLTGDMVDSNRVNIERSASLVSQLCQVAPVFYANGNHEAALTYNEYHRFTKLIRDAGATVLEDAEAILDVNGTYLQIVGLNDPGFIPGTNAEKFAEVERQLSRLARGDMFTLVLAHRPELIDNYAACGVELVLSGHVHGGQIRLPLIGGIYAPSQGLFPKYDAGLYTMNATAMIVSRGIGNSTFPLRFNNRPEVIIIALKSGK